jgi:hypothetical protein
MRTSEKTGGATALPRYSEAKAGLPARNRAALTVQHSNVVTIRRFNGLASQPSTRLRGCLQDNRPIRTDKQPIQNRNQYRLFAAIRAYLRSLPPFREFCQDRLPLEYAHNQSKSETCGSLWKATETYRRLPPVLRPDLNLNRRPSRTAVIRHWAFVIRSAMDNRQLRVHDTNRACETVLGCKVPPCRNN